MSEKATEVVSVPKFLDLIETLAAEKNNIEASRKD